MAILMLVFAIYLIYVSYCKIVYLLFKGKQYNRFFGTFISTFIPVIGSVPAFVMATKYERRVKNYASEWNDDILRYSSIAIQMLTVFLLFCPMFSSDGISSTGINLIFGNDISGSDMLKPTVLLIYILVMPFISALLTAIDRKCNVHNVVAYISSLVICLSLMVFLVLFSTEDMTPTLFFWIHCFMNVTVMLLSVFSLVIVRNEKLKEIEHIEKAEYIREQKKKNRRIEEKAPGSDTYKCAKCGSFVKKGEICRCISGRNSLNSLMQKSNETKKPSKVCIYCKKELAEGEKCDCNNSGLDITVNSRPYVGRTCKYCGQQLVGESTCVCEKILRNSQPVDGGNDEPDMDLKLSKKNFPGIKPLKKRSDKNN